MTRFNYFLIVWQNFRSVGRRSTWNESLEGRCDSMIEQAGVCIRTLFIAERGLSYAQKLQYCVSISPSKLRIINPHLHIFRWWNTNQSPSYLCKTLGLVELLAGVDDLGELRCLESTAVDCICFSSKLNLADFQKPSAKSINKSHLQHCYRPLNQ